MTFSSSASSVAGDQSEISVIFKTMRTFEKTI